MITDGNISVLDHYRFRDRGALDAQSHYVLNRTTCCSRQCVLDEEVDRLYFDSTDLSRYVELLVGVPCPFCGTAAQFDLSPIEELSDVGPEWKWAALER